MDLPRRFTRGSWQNWLGRAALFGVVGLFMFRAVNEWSRSGLGLLAVALIIAIGAMLAVPAVALWLLFADLTRFYFHANHIGSDGGETFTPRFTLTSLQLPSDELGPAALEQLSASRTDPRIVELLVPANDDCSMAPIATPATSAVGMLSSRAATAAAKPYSSTTVSPFAAGGCR